MPILRRSRRSDRRVVTAPSTGSSTERAATAPEPEGPHLSGRGPLEALLDRAVTVPSGVIHTHVETLRRRNPHASPEQIVGLLEKQYLRVVSATGGAVGSVAAVPAGGTAVAVALTAGDVAAFFAASAAFSLAVASVHGIEVEDVDRRRTLLLTTVLGEEGARELRDAIRTGSGAPAQTLLTRMPTTSIKTVNSTLTRRLLRRHVAGRGGVLIGRLAPFGIGAFVGVRAARALGGGVIDSARATFGPPPRDWPRVVEVVQPGGRTRLVEADRVDDVLGGTPGSTTPASDT